MIEFARTSLRLSQSNIHVLVWTLGTFLAATAGPFGTFAAHSFPERLVFWGTVIVTSTIVGERLGRLADRLAAGRGPWRRDGLLIGLMTLVFSPFVWIVDRFLLDPSGAPSNILNIMFYVASVSIGICATRRVVQNSFADTRPGAPTNTDVMPKAPAAPLPPEPATTRPDPAPRLMRRLPGTFDGQIIRLNVNDHQVKVVTTEGEYCVRLRFGDAIDEMDPVEGFCTHRSHWVARQAVSGSERERGKTYLRLVNGDRVPVSKTYLSDLEQEGLV